MSGPTPLSDKRRVIQSFFRCLIEFYHDQIRVALKADGTQRFRRPPVISCQTVGPPVSSPPEVWDSDDFCVIYGLHTAFLGPAWIERWSISILSCNPHRKACKINHLGGEEMGGPTKYHVFGAVLGRRVANFLFKCVIKFLNGLTLCD